jgi:hypothetical protein
MSHETAPHGILKFYGNPEYQALSALLPDLQRILHFDGYPA